MKKLLIAALVAAFTFTAIPNQAKADISWTVLPVLAAIAGGSLIINEFIMLNCQKRPLQGWHEVGASLIPVWSQAQTLKGCTPGNRKR